MSTSKIVTWTPLIANEECEKHCLNVVHLVYFRRLVLVIVLIPFILIATSYIQIIHTILQMPSAKGRHKAFFTCIAHLVLVILFYCTTALMHLKPKSTLLPNSSKMVALSYIVVTPMLNPIMYSLRNKVKHTLRKISGRRQFFSKVPLPRSSHWFSENCSHLKG